MTDEIAPQPEDVAVPADPTGQAGPDPSVKVKELEQRLRGLDAKVTTLQRERDAQAAKVAALESGQIDADATLKAQLQAKDHEIAALRSKAEALPKIAKFPNVAREMGESIASVPDEVLASLEAQLSQAPTTEAPPARPTPVPANPPDSDGSDFAGMSRDQILAEIGRTPGPFN